MNKVSLSEHLQKNSALISNLLQSISETALNQKNGDKWSVAENAIHLVKSVSPINLAMGMPKFTFLVFGKSDSSKSYGELVQFYESKLHEGATASRAYVPKAGTLFSKDRVVNSFQSNYDTLIDKLNNWSEDDLDRYRLPHPILGKLTIREMLYFTIYHLEHHYSNMKKLRA